MDRISDSGSEDGGSSPFGVTTFARQIANCQSFATFKCVVGDRFVLL